MAAATQSATTVASQARRTLDNLWLQAVSDNWGVVLVWLVIDSVGTLVWLR
jgi:hypothetical protein